MYLPWKVSINIKHVYLFVFFFPSSVWGRFLYRDLSQKTTHNRQTTGHYLICTHLLLIPHPRPHSRPLIRWDVRRGRVPGAEEITRNPENRYWGLCGRELKTSPDDFFLNNPFLRLWLSRARESSCPGTRTPRPVPGSNPGRWAVLHVAHGGREKRESAPFLPPWSLGRGCSLAEMGTLTWRPHGFPADRCSVRKPGTPALAA